MYNKKIIIIAEIAQGYEGNPVYSNLYVKAAAKAGADAVKFQLVYADELAVPDYKYYDLFKTLEMSDEIWQNIANVAAENNIALQLDVFGERSLKLAEKLNVNAVKIHATDISNKRLLNLVAKTNIKTILLGVGGGFQSEINVALEILANKEVVLLFGFQSYPTLNKDNHLSRIKFAKEKFTKENEHIHIGFADHANPDTNFHLGLGTLAIGLGANVLEKHLTLSKKMIMEDYESALNPDEFCDYVNFIHECSSALFETKNSDDFGMSESELTYRSVIRRHVVSINPIEEGHMISSDNLVLKRTSSDSAHFNINDIDGHIATTYVPANSPIEISKQ
jgi:N,N'-diacetyllegionaminate synthase